MTRVAIVGGGFSGLIFSLKLAEAGLNVTLFEEHDRVGYPPHCTGIISLSTLRYVGSIAKHHIESTLNSIKVECCGKTLAEIKVDGGLFKVDRVSLEKSLVREAERQGVDVRLGCKVYSVGLDGSLRSSCSPTSMYHLVIVADGWRRTISSKLGLGGYHRRLTGINVKTSCKSARRSTGYAIVRPLTPHSPDFFEWRVEMESGYTLLGAASSEPSTLRSILVNASKSGCKILSVDGGQVVLGPPRGPLTLGRVAVAGDAGGLTKPLTGGGLYPSAKAANMAKNMVERGVDPREAVGRSLEYVAKELRRQVLAAKLLFSSRHLYEAAAEVLEGPLEVNIDFDRIDTAALVRIAAGSLSRLKPWSLASPRLWMLLARAALSLFL